MCFQYVIVHTEGLTATHRETWVKLEDNTFHIIHSRGDTACPSHPKQLKNLPEPAKNVFYYLVAHIEVLTATLFRHITYLRGHTTWPNNPK